MLPVTFQFESQNLCITFLGTNQFKILGPEVKVCASLKTVQLHVHYFNFLDGVALAIESKVGPSRHTTSLQRL